MSNANYYDLGGDSIRVAWFPQGSGGPVRNPPGAGPVLQYTDLSGSQTFTGKELTIAPSPAGTFVTAVVKKTNIVPGGVTVFGVLFPDVDINGDAGKSQSVPVKAVGVLSIHRGTAQLGSGQLETYTTFPLAGTAASVILAG